MGETFAALAFAILLWWVGTGSILVAVGLPRRGLAAVMTLSLPLLAGAVILFGWAAEGTSSLHVYAAFGAAVAVWGWHEFAFLTGTITGPRRTACPAGARGWRRFSLAVGTLAWHELALLLTALALAALAWGAPNQIGLWTFLTLFAARISAKLNLFAGVPNFSDELITEPLAHMPSYFRRAPMTALFPVSIVLLVLTIGCWIERAHAAPTAGLEAGFVMLATMTTLALIEHWLLVLPLKDAALWRWMLPSRDARRKSLVTTDRAL